MIQIKQQQAEIFSTFFRNQMNRTKLKQELLKNRLHEFGLSPSDWNIIAEANRFRIIHVDTPDFQFIGQANASRTRWESMQLFSL